MRRLAYLPAVLLAAATLYCLYRAWAASESHSDVGAIVIGLFLGISALTGAGGLLAALVAWKMLRK